MEVPRLALERPEQSSPAVLTLLDSTPGSHQRAPELTFTVDRAGFTSDNVLLAQLAQPERSAGPNYEPNAWNRNPKIANCYVYALNNFNPKYHVDTTGMDPGDFADLDKFDLSSASGREMRKYANWLIDGALADGLRWTANNAKAAPGTYKVAMFVAPADPSATHESHMDYHWLRQDSNGQWSHKFGDRPVSNVDRAGQIITDPRSANLGSYHFVGYFDVPAGGIDLRRGGDGAYVPQRTSPAHSTMKAPPIPDGPRRAPSR